MNTYTNIQPKPRTVAGIPFQRKETTFEYNADIEPGKSIRVYGKYGEAAYRYKDQPAFDKTFKIGDWAEYDSYNFSYIGRIVGIGETTVTILPEHSNRKRRLDLYQFCWRNYDFDLKQIEERNHAVSLEI